MSYEGYQVAWYVLIAVLLAGYVLLDGFDLGVGILHLFEEEGGRRIGLHSIGPVWDGNEVWLVAGGGALFASFPAVYATVASACYLPLTFLLLALIARAVGLELRGKIDHVWWRRGCDWVFGLGSVAAALLLGTAFGNILQGLPLEADGRFIGSFLGLLNPYALLIGVLSVVLCALHGAAYLKLKGSGALRDQMQRVIPWLWIALMVLLGAAVVSGYWQARHLFSVVSLPMAWVLALVSVVALFWVPRANRSARDGAVMLSTGVMMLGLLGLVALSMFPRLLPSSIDLGFSLTAFNASSSELTLQTMFIIAMIGMPLVLLYTAWVYRVYWGKLEAEDLGGY